MRWWRKEALSAPVPRLCGFNRNSDSVQKLSLQPSCYVASCRFCGLIIRHQLQFRPSRAVSLSSCRNPDTKYSFSRGTHVNVVNVYYLEQLKSHTQLPPCLPLPSQARIAVLSTKAQLMSLFYILELCCLLAFTLYLYDTAIQLENYTRPHIMLIDSQSLFTYLMFDFVLRPRFLFCSFLPWLRCYKFH